MTELTAIVVTHNSAVHIGQSLTALRDAGVPVLVVDNASSDATATLVEQGHPEAGLTRNHANAGFARAVNQALARVGTRYVLLVNPDCVVPVATARGLLTQLRDRPDAGIAGPRLVGPDGRTAISAHPFESLASVVLSRFGGSVMPVGLRRLVCGARRRQAYDACRSTVDDEPVTVDWLSGACLAVRTDLLRDIGGLDEGYFLYYEDEELCLQAHRRGAAVVYRPDLVAMHVGGASSREPTATWPHLYRSMLVFFGRHRRSQYQAVRAAVLARAVLGLALGAARLAVRGGSGAARIRAWWTIALIAAAGHREPIGAPR
jgi:N-acetylglucosaminyl-diphospho-decaprenol L-rhamnosyltransferase